MFEGSEKRISKNGIISYWENGIILGKSCSKCGEIKKIDEFAFHNKKLKTYQTQCKECNKKYRKKNKETLKELGKRWRESNSEYHKQYYEENKEHYKEYNRQYYQNNIKNNKERKKQYYENNKEHIKEYYQNNKERKKEYSKQYYLDNQEQQKQRYESSKSNNIAEITQMLHQLSPIFKTLNIKAYGRIYKITNIKTKRIYIGQTILSLDARYGTNIIKGWIEHRKTFKNQKFLGELNNEEDFIIETIDFGCCKYHLDKLESYYINKYDSCNNGYNNNLGLHNTDDGINEFNKILEENKLVFKNGELQLIK